MRHFALLALIALPLQAFAVTDVMSTLESVQCGTSQSDPRVDLERTSDEDGNANKLVIDATIDGKTEQFLVQKAVLSDDDSLTISAVTRMSEEVTLITGVRSSIRIQQTNRPAIFKKLQSCFVALQ